MHPLSTWKAFEVCVWDIQLQSSLFPSSHIWGSTSTWNGDSDPGPA